jgi:hypothetical protein
VLSKLWQVHLPPCSKYHREFLSIFLLPFFLSPKSCLLFILGPCICPILQTTIASWPLSNCNPPNSLFGISLAPVTTPLPIIHIRLDDEMASDRTDLECPICYENGGFVYEFCKTSCGHVFHKTCLQSWLDSRPLQDCPWCRSHATVANNLAPSCRICEPNGTPVLANTLCTMPCGHLFHKHCISAVCHTWSGQCPLCRHDLRYRTCNHVPYFAGYPTGSQFPREMLAGVCHICAPTPRFQTRVMGDALWTGNRIRTAFPAALHNSVLWPHAFMFTHVLTNTITNFDKSLPSIPPTIWKLISDAQKLIYKTQEGIQTPGIRYLRRLSLAYLQSLWRLKDIFLFIFADRPPWQKKNLGWETFAQDLPIYYDALYHASWHFQELRRGTSYR